MYNPSEFNERVKKVHEQSIAASAPFANSSLTALEKAASENADTIASLEERQAQVRAGNQSYNGAVIANELEAARRLRTEISARLHGARGEAQAAEQAKLQHEKNEKAGQEKEAALRARYRNAWTGTDASFEMAWPKMLADHLASETRTNLDSIKQKMRAQLGL